LIDEAIQKFRKEIGDTFTELRLENGWNKRTAATLADIPQTTMTRIENATQDVYLSTLYKMAHAYGYAIEIGFVPLDESDISEGEIDGEDPNDVPEESGGPL
jgi:transcriptional regulator with XRE-family HTH domain